MEAASPSKAAPDAAKAADAADTSKAGGAASPSEPSAETRAKGRKLLLAGLRSGEAGRLLDQAAAAELEKQDPAAVAAQAVERLRAEIRGALLVCILGGTDFKGADSEALVTAAAAELAAVLGERVAFVTGGMPGVQRAFALHCGDGSRVWNLLPIGQSSSYGVGKDVHAGSDLEARKRVFGLLGDVYVTVEGGPGVAQEARAAAERGAAVVPLVRTGGASSGMFDFPVGALARPAFASERQWEALRNGDVPVAEAAAAVAAIVRNFVERQAAPDAPEAAGAAASPSKSGVAAKGRKLLLGGMRTGGAERVPDQQAQAKAEVGKQAVPKVANGAGPNADEEAVRKRVEDEAERKAKEEAERLAKEEAERKAVPKVANGSGPNADEEAVRKRVEEEAERKAKEEAERLAKEEAERKEAERRAKEEAERKAKEAAERKAKEEAERQAKEEAQQRAQAQQAESPRKDGGWFTSWWGGSSSSTPEKTEAKAAATAAKATPSPQPQPPSRSGHRMSLEAFLSDEIGELQQQKK
uniref:Uncharacterized protein n=1 Tax=Alexandrium monilatum TaxID=311494 RepID=A0A7S4QFT5_9DINO